MQKVSGVLKNRQETTYLPSSNNTQAPPRKLTWMRFGALPLSLTVLSVMSRRNELPRIRARRERAFVLVAAVAGLKLSYGAANIELPRRKLLTMSTTSPCH